MWMYAIASMVGGSPDIGGLPFHGYSLAAGPKGNYAFYIMSGTPTQLQNIAALPQVFPLVAMTDDGVRKFGELDGVVASKVRNKINAWLTAQGHPTIPAGRTNKQVLLALVQRIKRASDEFDLDGAWVKDA